MKFRAAWALSAALLVFSGAPLLSGCDGASSGEQAEGLRSIDLLASLANFEAASRVCYGVEVLNEEKEVVFSESAACSSVEASDKRAVIRGVCDRSDKNGDGLASSQAQFSIGSIFIRDEGGKEYLFEDWESSCDTAAGRKDCVVSFNCAAQTEPAPKVSIPISFNQCDFGTHSCSPLASCEGSKDGTYSCECKEGYKGDGKSCQDINECEAGANPCPSNSLCQNQEGSFSCTCEAGFQADGELCVDIDECAETPGICGSNSLCDNRPGSYDCRCEEGFFMKEGHCEAHRSCPEGEYVVSPGTATEDSVCAACEATVVPNCGAYQCESDGTSSCTACQSGYELRSGHCVDIDECLSKTHNCRYQAACVNTPGSFICACSSSTRISEPGCKNLDLVIWGDEYWDFDSTTDYASFVRISTYDTETVGLTGNGEIVSWRRSYSDLPKPQVGQPSPYVDVFQGHYNAFALKDDGRIEILGSTTDAIAEMPSTVNAGGDVVKVVSGGNYAAALKRDGSVEVWGSNDYDLKRLPSLGATGIRDIAGNSDNIVALRKDGRVIAWGYGIDEPNEPLFGMEGITQISVGPRFYMFVHEDREVYKATCLYSSHCEPELVFSGNVKAVAAGHDHGLILDDYYRELTLIGDEALDENRDPEMYVGDIVAISAGRDFSLALSRDGQVYAWGDRDHALQPQRMLPKLPEKTIMAMTNEDFVLFADGTVVDLYGYSQTGSLSEATLTENASFLSDSIGSFPAYLNLDGDGGLFILDDGYVNDVFTMDLVPKDFREARFRQISPGAMHVLGLSEAGDVLMWGADESREALEARELYDSELMGMLDLEAWRPPEGLSDVVEVSAGAAHSMALKRDGTVVAWGRGYDMLDHGQAEVPDDLGFITQIESGWFYSMALDIEGKVRAWGGGEEPFLLDGYPIDLHFSEVPEDLLPVTKMAAGIFYALALQVDGSVRSWGTELDELTEEEGYFDPPEEAQSGVVHIGTSAFSAYALKLRESTSQPRLAIEGLSQRVFLGGSSISIEGSGFQSLERVLLDWTLVPWRVHSETELELRLPNEDLNEASFRFVGAQNTVYIDGNNAFSILGLQDIPAGRYLKGSQGSSWAGPSEGAYEVTLTRGFSMTTNAITQGLWRQLMGRNPSFHSGDLNRPVDSVSWFSALVFANRLSEELGLEVCYDFSSLSCSGAAEEGSLSCNGTPGFIGLDCEGFRLPTEAEWEYAGKANSDRDTPLGDLTDGACSEDLFWNRIVYCGSNASSPISNDSNARQYKLPNPFGLRFMLGNVHEWVWDYDLETPTSPQTDPIQSSTGESRLAKGGSILSLSADCRPAARGQVFSPDSQRDDLGFRLVRTGLRH